MRFSLLALVLTIIGGCGSAPPAEAGDGVQVPEQRINQIQKDKSPDAPAPGSTDADN